MSEKITNSVINKLIKTDVGLTRLIYNLFDKNNIIKKLPYWLGLLPYEIYVIPGMYLSILQVIWLETVNPIQFHLLPHWFAYSFFQILKGTIKRSRPGCVNKDMSAHISKNHCEGKTFFQSLPSGHTGVAFALATALYMEMSYSKYPKFFEFPITTPGKQKIISMLGYFVATGISIHRISKGYHHVFDVIIGAILGSLIGYFSWTVINILKEKYYYFCEKYGYMEKKECQEYREDKLNLFENIKLAAKDIKNNEFNGNIRMKTVGKIILSVVVIALLTKFFRYDIHKLTAIKH